MYFSLIGARPSDINSSRASLFKHIWVWLYFYVSRNLRRSFPEYRHTFHYNSGISGFKFLLYLYFIYSACHQLSMLIFSVPLHEFTGCITDYNALARPAYKSRIRRCDKRGNARTYRFFINFHNLPSRIIYGYFGVFGGADQLYFQSVLHLSAVRISS